MTNEELVAQIQADVNVRDNMGQLYQQNRNFIIEIALPFLRASDLDDLMQEAYFGLYKAAQKFNPDLGFKFLTYAEDHIRSSIQRYRHNNGNLKRLPLHILERISKYQKFRSDFRAIVGDDPTDQEYCAHLGISAAQLKTLRSYMVENNVISLSDPVPGTGDFMVGETVADDYDLEESIIEQIAFQEGSKTLWEAVNDLEGHYPTVIEGSFKRNETLEQIADQIGTSKERVRQLKKKALGLLRQQKKVREAAEIFDYGCMQSYHWGVSRFKDTRISSTEFLALKRIEQEERRERIAEQAHDLTSVADLAAIRMAKETGQIPIGLKLWQEKQDQLERMLQQERDRRKKQEEGEPSDRERISERI